MAVMSEPLGGYPSPSNVCSNLTLSEGSDNPGSPNRGGAFRNRRAEQVVGVDDRVGVALFGEKPLAVGGVLGVQGVAGDHRVEVRLAAVGLRPQQPAQPLRLLLAGA